MTRRATFMPCTPLAKECMPTIQRILIIKLSSIGDVLHTLPAASALKQAYPQAEIDWLVEKKASVILTANPDLHDIVEVDTRRWRKSWLQMATWREITRLASHLRKRHYDLALDFQGLWKSALIGFLASPRRLAGFDRSVLKEPSCRLLYNQKATPASPARHVIEICGELARAVGAKLEEYRFPLYVPPVDQHYVAVQLEARQLEKYVIINPGGGWPTKNWAPENYGRLAAKLQKELGLACVVTWGPGEEALVKVIQQGCPEQPPVAIPTTLMQFVALARRARLFVGGDTGPMHLAAAVGTPIVALFGPSDPARNGPFDAKDRVVYHPLECSCCYKRRCEKHQARCMQQISVEEVFKAVRERLEVR